MIKSIKKIVLSALMLSMILAAGKAETSVIREAIGFLDMQNPVSITIAAEIGKAGPYDEVRTEKLNRLLQHFSFSGVIDSYESELSVSLDDRQLFSLIRRQLTKTSEMILATDSYHYYIVPEGQENAAGYAFFSSDSLDRILTNRDILCSLDEYRSFLEQLPIYFSEKASETKILEKYRDYGTAVKKITISLNGEDLNLFFSENADLFQERNIIPDPREVFFSERQGFTLLFTEDNHLLKANYSGKAGISENDIRTVRLEWKTVRSETLEKDELQIRTPNAEGTRRNNYLLDYIWKKTEDGAESFSWSAETDRLADGSRKQGKILYELTASDLQVSGTLSDTMSEKSVSVTTDARISYNKKDNSHYSGTLEIMNKKDKIVTGCLDIRFDFTTDAAMQVTADHPDPLTVTEEEYDCIRESLYAEILCEILKLPEEDLVFLNEGITAEAWDSLVTDSEPKKEPAQ